MLTKQHQVYINIFDVVGQDQTLRVENDTFAEYIRRNIIFIRHI